jgi:hypothetical protein
LTLYWSWLWGGHSQWQKLPKLALFKAFKKSMKEKEFEKYLKVNSSRHHYIPQFLIKNFVDKNGMLYVYDKKKDEILSKQKAPKSLFFELNRNTVELTNELKSSILEDTVYSEIDTKMSKVIKYFQTEDLKNIDFKFEDTASLTFFLISLFWRIPKTDYASEDVIKRSIIHSENEEVEKLKENLALKKILRAGLFKHHVDEICQFGRKVTKWRNIHQNKKTTYVIGDYPFLLRRETNLFREFTDIDLLFAVSSTRIYSETNEKLSKFTSLNSNCYNAGIIHQSVNYVACADKDVLTNSVNFYKKLKDIGLIYTNEGAFEN